MGTGGQCVLHNAAGRLDLFWVNRGLEPVLGSRAWSGCLDFAARSTFRGSRHGRASFGLGGHDRSSLIGLKLEYYLYLIWLKLTWGSTRSSAVLLQRLSRRTRW